MKVCLASYHCCIRVVKEMLALNGAGVETVSLCHHMANTDLKYLHQSIIYYEDQTDYKEKLVSLRDIDLIHVHNEPDWLGRVARNARPDLPVVFDAHDLNSIRLGWIEHDEKFVFENCDGFIFPSESYESIIRQQFSIDKERTAVVYSMNPKRHVVRVPKPRMNGVVYEGGLTVEERQPGTETLDYMMRDLRELAWALFESGIPFVIFGANGDYYSHYVPTGAFCLPPSQYEYMMGELSRFDWGLIGNIYNCSQRKYAMPNKLFEYIAAGIPTVVFNAEECGKFVEKHGLGIHVSTLEEFISRYDEHEQIRKNVHEKQLLFVMENQLGLIFDVYDAARRNHERVIRDGSAFLVGPSGLGERRGKLCYRSEDCGCAFCQGVAWAA